MSDISVCIITKNEAEKLRKCLESIKPYDFEIVVVDTGSSDDTYKVIQEYADISGEFRWCDDFSKARNYSISLATNELILVLDSDEWIEYCDLDKIEELYNEENYYFYQKHDRIVGRIERINDISTDGRLEKGHERIPRLFNKTMCGYRGRIHEQIAGRGGDDLIYEDIPLIVGHSGYVGSAADKGEKADRNIRLLKLDLQENGPDPYVYYQLGKSYYMKQDYANACTFFEKGLGFDLEPELEFVQDMVETYGYALLKENRVAEMMFLENVYEEFAVSADYVFLMGLAYMNNELFDEAIEQFEKATTYKLCKVEGCNSFKAYYNAGVICECLGDTKKAGSYYKKCGSYQPAVDGLERINKLR